MSGKVISVLSLEGRYYNCHERAQRARDNCDIVTSVIQLISPSQSCDNLFITYLCLYQALNRENTGILYQGDISFLCPPVINLIKAQVCDKLVLQGGGRMPPPFL